MKHWKATWLASTCTLVLFATGANATIITEGTDFGNTLLLATPVSALSPDIIQGTVSPTDQDDYLKWSGLAPGTPYTFDSGGFFVEASVSLLNSAGGFLTSFGSGTVPSDGILIAHAFDGGFLPNDFPTEGYSVRLNAQRASSVPEPASLALFGVGLAGMFGLRRRKPSQNAKSPVLT